MRNTGIIGIGVHLPEQVRRNDWWPSTVTQKWMEKLGRSFFRREQEFGADASLGTRLALEEMQRLQSDPFQGAAERRIAPPSLTTLDMEEAAARDALARSSVPASEIDLVLAYSGCPEVLNVSGACSIHGRLGLPQRCLALSVDAACDSFLMQLSLAESMIAAGKVRYALLVQSLNVTRLLPMEEPPSAWFGDGATAVVVGPVDEDRGLLAWSHRTDGTLNRTLVYSVPGKNWYEEGRVVMHTLDPGGASRMLLSLGDYSAQVVGECLNEARVAPEKVDFYASHQGTAWLRRVTQQTAGLTNARFIDTYRWTASIGACNLPLEMRIAQDEGLIQPGSVIAMFAGGSGITWSGAVLRWA